MSNLKYKVNGHFTDVVHIDSLKENQFNSQIYGATHTDKGDLVNIDYKEDHKEYIETLANSIHDVGLDTPIDTCDDKSTMVGGHHRKFALEYLHKKYPELGYDWVPIVALKQSVKQLLKDKLGTMQLIVRNNMQHDYSEWDRLCQSLKYIQEFQKEKKRHIGEREFNDKFGTFIGFTWKKIKMFFDIWDGYDTTGRKEDYGKVPERQELLKDIREGKHSLNWCHATQWNDHKADVDENARKQLSEHDNLDLEPSVKIALDYSQKFVQDIRNYEVSIGGEILNLGSIQDDATLSGLLHGGIVKVLPAILNQNLGIKCKAPDGGSHFDIIAESQDSTGKHAWELEVKTTTGDKGTWSSGTTKTGYGLFVAADKEFSHFFAAYCYIPASYIDPYTKEEKKPWTSGGAMKTKKLSRNTLKRLIDLGYGKVLHGSMSIENKTKKVNVFLYPL